MKVKDNITMTSQLFKQNTQLMNINDLKDIHNIETNVLKYHGLFSIISRNFREPVKTQFYSHRLSLKQPQVYNR